MSLWNFGVRDTSQLKEISEPSSRSGAPQTQSLAVRLVNIVKKLGNPMAPLEPLTEAGKASGEGFTTAVKSVETGIQSGVTKLVIIGALILVGVIAVKTVINKAVTV